MVREYEGTLHEVMVVPGGFSWRENTYASLSTVARAITGASWNGPRFFGLRGTSDLDVPVEVDIAPEGIVDEDRLGQGRGCEAATQAPQPFKMCDRDLVAMHIERIVLRARSIDITLRGAGSKSSSFEEQEKGANRQIPADGEHATRTNARRAPLVTASTTIQIPWMPAMSRARKGIAWQPAGISSLDPVTRHTLLTAIAKARKWMNDLGGGRATSFREIAKRDGKAERHVRFLAPLAFLSPRIVEAIVRGEARPDLTVTMLARTLPHRWADQQSKLANA
jgi:Protein of unknown function (DUF2924)